jgi:hypothetical protein
MIGHARHTAQYAKSRFAACTCISLDRFQNWLSTRNHEAVQTMIETQSLQASPKNLANRLRGHIKKLTTLITPRYLQCLYLNHWASVHYAHFVQFGKGPCLDKAISHKHELVQLTPWDHSK